GLSRRLVRQPDHHPNRLLRADAAAAPTRLSFTPTLAPMARGILATITADLREAAPRTAEGLLDAAALADQLSQAFAQAYSDEPFVPPLPEGPWPHTSATAASHMPPTQLTADGRATHSL